MQEQDTDPAESFDWEAIERTPDFQELVNGRRRFAWTVWHDRRGPGALYVVLAGVAPDLMGTHLFGSMSIGFAGGVGLILVTWAITLAYVRRSDRVWGPLEERIREHARRSAQGGGRSAPEEPQEVSP